MNAIFDTLSNIEHLDFLIFMFLASGLMYYGAYKVKTYNPDKSKAKNPK